MLHVGFFLEMMSSSTKPKVEDVSFLRASYEIIINKRHLKKPTTVEFVGFSF